MRTLILLVLLFAGQIKAQTTLLWSETAGTSASSQKSFVATDLLGNIYMASSVNGTYGLDWKVSSWRPDSVSRWTYTYNGSGNLDDIPAAIVVDSAFSVYVTGTTKSSGSNDIRMIKLDSAGTLKWGTNYNRTGSAQDVATGLAICGSKLYVSGYSQQSTSNYDYTLLKYDTAGTLAWSRHANGTGSGDDYTTSLAVKTSGSDIYITGNGVITGGTRDMMTLRYANDGTLMWTKYYGNTTSQNDYANAIAINYSGDIIVTGQSYVTSSNSNLVTVKYSGSTGTQAWAASYAGTHGGHDAAYAVLIDPNNYFYVTGYTQVGSSNTDYVTIHYQGNGTLVWAQTYNGPGNSTDEACAMIHDGNDIVVTGKSTGSGTGLDVCTISMLKSNGSVNWTMRKNATSDVAFSIARDEMGNILVSHNETSGSSYVNSCIKYYQKAKNDAAISKNLEVLATGFSTLKTDTVFKRVIWNNIIRAFDDSIYIMYADYLRTLGDAAGITATSKINAKIATTYSWNSVYNWSVIKSKQMWNHRGKVNPLMGIPKLYRYSKSGFISSAPDVGFAHTQTKYPIGCVTCGGSPIDTTVINSKSVWVFTINVYPYIYYPGRTPYPIVNCILGTTPTYMCEVCSGGPVTSYPVTSYGGTGHHEFGVIVDIGDFNHYYCNGNILDANANDNYGSGDIYPYNYGRVRALPGVYWRQNPNITGARKIGRSYSNHLIDNQGSIPDSAQSYQSSNTIYLCSNNPAEFHSYGETTDRYSIDLGGFYMIEAPTVNSLAPMYVYITPFAGVNYTGAPDQNIKFGAIDNETTCSSGGPSFSPDPEICNSIPGYCTDDFLGVANSYGLYINPSLDSLKAYWMDNAIVVGAMGNKNGGTLMNFAEFFADTNGTACDPLQLPDVGNLICDLQCYSNNEFEILDSLTMSVLQGDSLIVHVQATYPNGETIDQCKYIVVNSNVPYVKAISVAIRGDIDDYSASPVNYRIEIYATVP